MMLFFHPLFHELIALEQGVTFNYNYNDNNPNLTRVFFIGSYCDQPEQALVLVLPEPVATYGCGRCEVNGR